MTENKIEVEYITTVAGALQAVEKLNKRLDQQEQKLQRVGDTSKKTADGAVNSFAKLEQTLKLNEKALQNMSVGSIEFDKQLQKVNRLREAHKKMRDTIQGGGQQSQGVSAKAAKGSIEDVGSQLKAVEAQLRRTATGTAEFAKLEQVVSRLRGKYGELTASMQQLGVVQKAVIPQAAGSFNAVETQLREAEQALRGLTAGTKQFVEQTQTVKRLREEHSRLKDAMLGVRTVRGSFEELEQSLRDNEAALRRMAIGSKAFTEQKNKVDDLRKSLAGAKGQLSTVADGASAKLSSAVGQVTGLVTGMVSFQAVVTAIVEEFKKAESMRLSAAATARTFEQALADVGQNIGADAVPQAKQMIIEQAPKLATTQEGLADLLGIAISAGAKDLEEAMALSSAALKLTVGDAAKAKALVGGTLDVASLGGSKNFEGALGQLLQTQSQVRSTNLSEFAANIGPGLAAATADGKNQKGVSTERALEMASVISQIIKDPTGNNTATTMRYLFTRMNAFMPEREKKLDDGGLAKVSKEQIAAFDVLKTFDERLQMMQAVPAIGAQFLETQRESIGKTAISEIINKSGRAVQFEDKAKANIAAIDDAQGFFAGLVDKVNQETGILTAERQSVSAVQKAEVTGSRSLEGQVTEIVKRGFEKVNLPGLDMLYSRAANVSLQDSLRRGEDPIAAGRQLLEGVRSRFDTSEEDKAALRDQIAVLDRLATTMQNLNDNIQNQKPKVIVPAGRPKEAPLPAATAP